ncbi:fimbrial protein [Proteus mirabilis]|uniref:fimbrial protein n=1 Tax=Proteus mirabilis TaxID=584 RepID=UPI0034E49C81
MKFNKLGVMVAGALLMGSLSTQVMAAKNADVTFTGRLVAATCDVTPSKASIDLGTYVTSEITGTATPLGERDFSLTLNNCTKYSQPDDDDNTVSNIELMATGTALVGNNKLFSSPDSSDLGQAGIKITAMGKEILPNKSAELNLKAEGTKEDNIIVPMKAGLYVTSTEASLNPQDIRVPVTFSVAYN